MNHGIHGFRVLMSLGIPNPDEVEDDNMLIRHDNT